MSFNPLSTVASFIAALQTGQSFDLYDGDVKPLKGDNPAEAIRYTVSVGSGRGSARVDLNGAQVADVVEELRAFDPEADLSNVPPAECIARTIRQEKDGATTFRLSLAKNSRAVKIPAGEWDNFLAYMDTVNETISVAVAHFQGLVREQEEAANAK